MERSYVVIIVTASSREEADRIGDNLLRERLVACANVIAPVSSRFWWAGKLESAEECILLLKSRLDLFEKVSEKVRSLHGYTVPEIIALPILRGSEAYLEWLDSCLI